MSTKNILKKEYSRLKKVVEKILTTNNKERQPQLLLQPHQNKKYYKDK